MKKSVKITIGIVAAIAILIIVISLFFPAVMKDLATGTIGKADKYHKQQMTEKDVMLRSEFTSDTAQLKSMIQGLIYFSIFTQELSTSIDSCVKSSRAIGMGKNPEEAARLNVLTDYSGFIKNNNKTLGTTISMLTGFYLKDGSDQSADVEKNLRDFSTYVNNLNERDSALNLALRSMDNFMMTNKSLKMKKTELANLKSIRDQLLIQSIQLSAVLQDKSLSVELVEYALSSQEGLNRVLSGTGNLGLYQNSLKLIKNEADLGKIGLAFNSSAQLNDMISAQQLSKNGLSDKELGNLSGKGMVYDKENLQFLVKSSSELQQVLSSSELSAINSSAPLSKIICVVYFSAVGLNFIAANIDLKSRFNAQLSNLAATLSAAQLNQVLSNEQGLGIIIPATGFINLRNQLESQQIGVGTGY
jgi:hypothetical protein